LLEFLESIF